MKVILLIMIIIIIINRYAISQAWVEVHISNYSLSQDFQGFPEFPGHLVFFNR